MTDPTTWEALRQLRLGGKKPQLPVFITLNPHLPETFDGVGVMTIVHERGTEFPYVLLDGLHVICFFDECYMRDKILRAMRGKGYEPASMRAWCKCAQAVNTTVMTCAQFPDFTNWLESGRQPKEETA